jgi:hypothetical protein
MAPRFPRVYFIGVLLIPILPIAARGLLLPFFGYLLESLFEVFRRQNHLHAGDSPPDKGGLHILHEGSSPEVE